MPASKRQPAGPSDPHLALAKAILQLKLKTASLKTDGSSKALRECIKAAGEVDGCLGILEAGPSLLQLALSQANAPPATKLKDQARQLSSDAAGLLESLSRCADVSEETTWQLLRPILRLLLWLVPEHAPMYSGGAAHETSQAAGKSAPSHNQDQQTKPGAGSGGGWRQAVAQGFILDVVTMPLAEATLAALDWSAGDLDSPVVAYMPPGPLGFRVLEEGLAWLTVLARLRNLALELQADMGQPAQPPNPGKPKRGAPQDTSLAGLLIPKLAGRMKLLSTRCQAVLFWLKGRTQLGSSTTWYQSVTAEEERVFATRYTPSTQMANATGLWGGVPVVGQRVVGLLCGLLPHKFWDALNSTSDHTRAVAAHSELLTGLLASDYGLVSAPQVADHREHLDVKFKMHLQGLLLALRAAVGTAPVNLIKSAWVTAGIALWYGACHVLRLELAILRAGGARGARRIQSCMYQPGQAGRARSAERSSPSYLLSQMARCDECSLFKQDGTPLPAPDPSQDWTATAATFAEALRLMTQITRTFLEPKQGQRAGDQEVNMKNLIQSALVTMPWLRPVTPEMFSANAAASTAWASCMVTILELSDLLSTWDPRAHEGPDHDRALDLLLGQLLPVLLHVRAAPLHQEGVDSKGGVHQQPDQPAAHAGQPGSEVTPSGSIAGRVAGTGPSSSSPTDPAGQASGSSSAGGGVVVTAPCLPTPDSTLMLLSASSQLLSRITLAEEAAAASLKASPTNGSSPQRHAAGHGLKQSVQRGQDTGHALEACLSLAHRLVADRSLWQVAKARNPLLLIEVLDTTATGLACVATVAARWWRASWAGESGGSSNQEARQATWSAAADWRQPGATFQEHLDRQVASPEYSISALGLAATAGVQEQGSSSAGASDQPSMPSTAMRCTTLLVELALQLWSLLFDASIVGDQDCPASWMLSRDSTSHKLCDSLSGMLIEMDACVSTFLRSQFGNNTAQQAFPEKGDAVRVALQLASLVPAVPWNRFREAKVWDAPELSLYKKLAALAVQMCAHPLLRVVCMLALVGLLTEHQRQGVVALLGGVCSSSCVASASGSVTAGSMAEEAQRQSSLLIPEPASVAATRKQHNTSLSHLAVVTLWTQWGYLPDPREQIKSITALLLSSFGAEQLPAMARIQEYLMAQHADDTSSFEYFGIPMAATGCYLQPSFKDTYLGWMQATLLKIISEVLTQHGP